MRPQHPKRQATALGQTRLASLRGHGLALGCFLALGVGAVRADDLELIHSYRDAPLDGPVAVAVSSDGRHLYVASLFDDAVTTFARNSVSGSLSFVDTTFLSAANGRYGAYDLALSADNQQLYAIDIRGNALTVFTRDVDSGSLELLETHVDGVDGVDGLAAPTAVLVTLDHRQVLVLGAFDGTLSVFDREASNGRLSYRPEAGLAGIGSMSEMTLSPDGRHLYLVAGERITNGPSLQHPDGSLTFVERDPDTGTLTSRQIFNERDDGPFGLVSTAAVALAPDGRHLYAVGGLGFGQIAIFKRDPGTGRLSFTEFIEGDDDTVDGLASARDVVISDDGRHVIVVGASENPGDHLVKRFERDPATGSLSFAAADFAAGVEITSSAAQAGLTLSPDGRHLYAVDQFLDQITILSRDPASGEIESTAVHTQGADGIDALGGASDITTSPNGDRIYVASTAEQSVAVFEPDPLTAGLRFVGSHFNGVDGVSGLEAPRTMTLSPDARHLYVAGGGGGAVFARDPSAAPTGLRFVADLDAFHGWDLTASPDGRHIYLAFGDPSGYEPGPPGITTLARNPTTGLITEVETLYGFGRGFDDGMPGLQAVRSISISPDGRHLYSAAFGSSAVLTFDRDPTSGRLLVRQTLTQHDDGIPSLAQARAITVSRDGRQVYVAAAPFLDPPERIGGALTVFHRDPTTGALALAEEHVDGTSGINGLGGAVAIVEGQDGRRIFVASQSMSGFGDDALAVFERDPATGNLRFLEATLAGQDGVDGLYGAQALAVRPGAADLYLASRYESALNLFRPSCETGPSTLCFHDRFRVEVGWRSLTTAGNAQVAVTGGDSGIFWFFQPDNWEMLIKVLDGCAVNHHFWVFSAAVTDVGFTLRVTDTMTGAVKQYDNPIGVAAPAVTDTQAFAACSSAAP